MSTIDERFMREALDEARAAAAEGEVPVGAVVVQAGRVIARAHNRREAEGDPSAHAEFRAIVAAARALGRWRLSDCTVYVTLEPCTMCAGLMVNARVGRCVYGAADPKAGALGSLYHLNADTRLNHAFAVRAGVLEGDCSSLLREFFADARVRRESDKPRAVDRIEPVACECGESAAVPALRVLLAVDSFKGSATSAQAEAWLAQGVRRAMPNAQITALPIADGGEGTVEAVYAARGGSWCELTVQGPCGGRHRARYLLVEDSVSGGEPASAVTAAGGGGLAGVGERLGAGAAADAGAPASAPAGGPKGSGAEGSVGVSAAPGLDAAAGAVIAAGTGAAVGVGAVVGAGTAAASTGGRQAHLPGPDGGAACHPFAVIEMAEAAGIGYSACTLADALTASTFGVGELVLDAVARGARTIYVGLGGSATNDGGAGMLQALGARVLDAGGTPVRPGLAGLRDVAFIDLTPAVQALAGVRLVVLTDVKNPLVGERGALAVFGPQKGLRFESVACCGAESVAGSAGGDVASAPFGGAPAAAFAAPEAVLGEPSLAACNRWMRAYATKLTVARDALDGTALQVAAPGARPRQLAGVPGAGAAGGLGAAFVALGACLTSGIETVLDLVGFDEAAGAAELVVTGEGNMDAQTAEGKAPVGVAARAKAANPQVTVVAVCGGRAEDLGAVYDAGIDVVLPIARRPMALDEALTPEQTRANLIVAGESVARIGLLVR